ncbi:MAG: penicillin acylase family protein [Spirochaetota bacterium]
MNLLKKPLIYYISAALIIVITVLIIILINKNSASYDGKVYAAVESEITIVRDENGIPSVKSSSINDAYFSIGFLHCQDRHSLIEYFRAIANGHLPELKNNDGILLNKLSLTIGFAREAEKILTRIKNPYKDYLDSYVKGINASKKEFFGISQKRFSSSEWTAKDVISILIMFEWADSFLNNRKLIFPLPEKIDQKNLKEIIPPGLLHQYSDDERSSVNLLVKIRNTVLESIGQFQEGFAFYIGGENMEDGKAVSGFSLDGRMSIYPKWYPVTVTVGEKRIHGVTASGLPFIFFGRNEDISFSGFNLNVETQDFFIERTRVFNGTKQYYMNGVWKNFNLIDEKLAPGTKGDSEDESALAVRATDIGPVISDLISREEDSYTISINSIFPDESYIHLLFEIPLANSIANAKNLLWNIYSLPRLYLFANDDDAVCAFSGKIPQRFQGRFFNDSSAYTAGIFDILYYGKKSATYNLIIGNNIFETEPAIIKDRLVYKDQLRYDTLKDLVEKEDYLTSKDITAAMSNTRSALAEQFVPEFLSMLEQMPLPSAKLCRIYFNNWNYNMAPDSVAATIFNTLLIKMLEETIKDEMGNSNRVLMENYYYLINRFYDLVLKGNSAIFNDITTKGNIENKENIFDRAFIKMLRSLSKQSGPEMNNWKWGKYHKGNFKMPADRKELKHIAIAGGSSTINKGEVSAVNLLKPVNVSLISGIFYMDLHLSFLSLGVSPTLDTSSDYFKSSVSFGNFVSIDSTEAQHTLRLLPLKK